MVGNQAVCEIVDNAVKNITKRLAKLELCPSANGFDENGDIASLRVTVAGEYRITIICQAQLSLLRMIAGQMKRGDPEDEEEIIMYLKEYFNILCGHVVTSLNKLMHTQARFGIPDFANGVYRLDPKMQPFFELCYKSTQGDIRIRGVCEGPELSEHLSQLKIPS